MSQKPDSDQELHWLVRPKTIRLLWWLFSAILALTLIAQFYVHIHEYFTVDGWPGFYAIFGFLSCVAMVVFAKVLGFVLKRPDNFYDDV
jgi:hypothetical protein